MCGCEYVWILECVGMCSYVFCNVSMRVYVGLVMCMCAFCNVWVCVCVDFVMCVYVWIL